MAQGANTPPGYQAFSVSIPTSGGQLAALVLAQLGYTIGGAYRNVRIEIDTEAGTHNVRIGDATVGTTVDSIVQKGRTLIPQGADNPMAFFAEYNSGAVDDVFVQSMYLQAISGAQVVNVELHRM